MIKTILSVTFLCSFTFALSAQSWEKGPFTVHVITENVYRIEDANSNNPPGVLVGDDGQMVSMNNCSDIYLIVGGEKGLLIDLSNRIERDNTAMESLRSLVAENLRGRQLYITLTHRHGDHMGMLPAFQDDTEATFWIPENEFAGMDLFPADRTIYFEENASLDLGSGKVVKTKEVPGHTAHSTIYFLQEENLAFTGDAIGSGSGVWLFDEESFYVYSEAIDRLIEYMEDRDNNIDKDALTIYGGHFWQGEEVGKLTGRYIYDMRTLIKKMREGTAEVEEMSAFTPFLNANFKYGTATITWNREAAERLVGLHSI